MLCLDNQPKLLNEIKSTYRWETVPVVVEITEGQEKFIGGLLISKNTY